VLTAFLYGLATAVPLVIGAAIGMRWKLPTPLLAGLMAFGAGTLVAAASEELFGPAFEKSPVLVVGSALLVGAAVYVVINHVLETRYDMSAAGLALMAGAVLDGIPENTALGVSMTGGSVALLVAIVVGNTPEAIGSAAILRDDPDVGVGRGLLMWTTVGVVLVAVTVGAHTAMDDVNVATIGTAEAFAGGATIAVLADTLMPEAYKEGGWWVGLATALGFLVAYLLGG
jgi:ZIP family zinc transporter